MLKILKNWMKNLLILIADVILKNDIQKSKKRTIY
jgi:hypothetical protein